MTGTVRLCGLVVRALDQQLRGIGFDPPPEALYFSVINHGIIQKNNYSIIINNEHD